MMRGSIMDQPNFRENCTKIEPALMETRQLVQTFNSLPFIRLKGLMIPMVFLVLQFIQTPKEEILTTFGSLKIQELLITLS